MQALSLRDSEQKVIALSQGERIQSGESLGEWYDIATSRHFWMQVRLSNLKKLLLQADITFSDMKVLEIGCGSGALRQQLEQSFGCAIDACDLNLPALELAAKAAKGETYFYNIAECRQDMKNKYDAVILFDVIEHIEDVNAFLKAASFHLKSGGLILINVPAREEFFSIYDTAAGHLRRYSKDSLASSLSGAGIKVLNIEYWGLSFIPLLYLRKALLALQKNLSHETIIKNGFKPPHPILNRVLEFLGNFEAKIIASVPIGTSLMTIGVVK